MAGGEPLRPPIYMYAVAIRAGIAEGDLGKMKELQAEAERQLAEQDELRAALDTLKQEIARAESSGP